LSGTRSLRIHYGNPKVDLTTHAFTDSDWASCAIDRLSVSGYIWYFYGGPVTHASKKQSTHVLSSAEAEYMALSACAQEGLWLKSFFLSIRRPLSLPLRIHADNTAVISLASLPSNRSNARHISTRYHFIREHVSSGVFLLQWTPTHRNVADVLTKCLPRPAFVAHRTSLSLVSR
jgi:hypothetical protein